MSALERLQSRIAKRTEALRGAHMPAPPANEDAAHAELLTLGAYVMGEARAVTMRRVFVQRWVRSRERGCYSDPGPLPTTDAAARAELSTLGPYVLGEPGRTSRRRAALLRARPGLGAYAARLELEALGAYQESEPHAVTRRRDALEKRARSR